MTWDGSIATIPGGMMRKVMIAAAIMTVAVSAPAAAQGGWSFGFLGGATMLTGDAENALKTGFHGGALIGMRHPGGKIGWGVETQFHRHSYKDILGIDVDANLNAYGAMARLDFAVAPNIYLIGGAGLYRTEVTGDDDLPDFESTSNTKFAWQGGLGMNFGPGLFVEGKYLKISGDNGISMIPLSIGVRF
jgi:opacity protein-like surface antigen